MDVHAHPPEAYIYPDGHATAFAFTLQQVDGPLKSVYVCDDQRIPFAPIDFGCTAVVAVLIDDTLVIGNAGGSRHAASLSEYLGVIFGSI